MTKKIASISVKLLCLLMVFALAAGCRKSPGDSSSDYYTSEIIVDDDTSGSTSGGDGKGTDASGTTSDGSKASGTASTGNGKDKPNAGTTGGKVNPEKYRGTTVRYATWKNPYQNEDGKVVEKFQKKYGIKVKIDTIPQSTYVQEVTGKIAAGNSPDIFFDNGTFPASIACLQPLEAMQLDLNDGIWDQGMIKMSTLGGKPFLVNTVGNIWAEVDCLFYNKKIFTDHNITTPEEYYKAGKWTFATLTKCMTDVKNAGYIGGYVDVQSLLASTGTGFYGLKNGTITNCVNEMTYNVMTQISQWVSDGLIKNPLERNLLQNFIKGKAGIAITNAYGLKATGYFSEMNPNNVGFTYIPKYDDKTKAYTTGLFRGWGLIRGSKNPVAAGIFLRYYLDVNNYDTNSAFINNEAKQFFFKLTSGVKTDNKNPYLILGVASLCSESTDKYNGFAAEAPGQVRTKMQAFLPTINNNVKKVNEEMTKQIKSLGLK